MRRGWPCKATRRYGNIRDAGEFLRWLRRQGADLSQAELAERIGIAQQTVSEVEGRSDCLLSTFDRFVGALGYRWTVSVTPQDAREGA